MASNRDLEQQVTELTQKLEALQAAVMRREDVPAPEQPADHAADHVVSRRGLLTSLPVLAAAGAGAMALSGLTASPAAAAAGDPLLLGQSNDPSDQTTSLFMTNSTDYALDVTTGGIHASTMHIGDGQVNDDGDLTVLRYDDYTLYVECRNQVSSSADHGGSAIYADGFMAAAIVVDGYEGLPNGQSQPNNVTPGLGLDITGHDSSPGIHVKTDAAELLHASQGDTSTSTDAAQIVTHGLGRGLYVQSVNTSNANGTITGVNAGSGAGVWGTNSSSSHAGIGVVGVGGTIGRGGRFRGGAAAVQLQPSTASTHPGSGQAGDLFVDASHRLWFCKGGTTWHQLA